MLPNNEGYVIFTIDALQHMYKHAQMSIMCNEAGGQLFTPSPESFGILITKVTGPNQRDIRSRFGYIPNIEEAWSDRKTAFAEGSHVIGMWHTHPQAYPIPSKLDRQTTLQYLNDFKGDLSGFLQVILGNHGNPLNMAVWFTSTKMTNDWYQLTEHK